MCLYIHALYKAIFCRYFMQWQLEYNYSNKYHKSAAFCCIKKLMRNAMLLNICKGLKRIKAWRFERLLKSLKSGWETVCIWGEFVWRESVFVFWLCCMWYLYNVYEAFAGHGCTQWTAIAVKASDRDNINATNTYIQTYTFICANFHFFVYPNFYL